MDDAGRKLLEHVEQLAMQIQAEQREIRDMLTRRQKGALRQATYEHRKRQSDALPTSERQNDAGGEGGVSLKAVEATTKNDLEIIHTSANVRMTRQTDARSERQTDGARVFDFWVQHMCKDARVRFRGKRQAKVVARLADGYSVEQLCDAVRGCRLSPHHMGENSSGAKYDDLELICRDEIHVDRFISIAQGGGPAKVLSIDALAKARADDLAEKQRKATQILLEQQQAERPDRTSPEEAKKRIDMLKNTVLLGMGSKASE